MTNLAEKHAGKLKKYSWLFHVLVVVAVYVIYYAYPAYGLPAYLSKGFLLAYIVYGVLGILSIKDAVEEKNSKYFKSALFFFICGGFISVANVIRTVGY